MLSRRARLTLIAGVVVLLAASVVWSRQVSAQPWVGDFPPTRSADEAAARVRAAVETQKRQSADALQYTTNLNQLPLVPTVFFPQTGHHLSNRAGFLDFWRTNGQVLIFGYPTSEEIIENGRVVQYFERARFEYHPELTGRTGEVQLGLLGREFLTGGVVAGVPDPRDGTRYFPETQHTLSGEFLSYWERRGGISIFGYPISEELEENGQVVQYFERARLEYHPEDMEPFYRNMEQANSIALNTLHEVLVSELGRQVAQSRGVSTAPVARLAGAREWSPALWNRRIEVSLSSQWLTAYEDELPVYRAPVATGRDGFNTPTGSFAIYDKLPVQTMTGSAGEESWYVPDVPWVQYVVGGVALHGTYWHNQFGTGYRLSHGCINLSMDDAEWLFGWADIGTTVVVRA
jgi:hypothetical protein